MSAQDGNPRHTKDSADTIQKMSQQLLSSPSPRSTSTSSSISCSSTLSGSLKLRKGDTLVVQMVQGVDLVVADANGKSDP